ncbi:hypothetical protein EVAR_91669_1 [Eumeta japonica]|uniref:Uncharacterized protein n=1 Tax=Eumeta variegata TaxID=151549 RepID=A0A4C1Z649_EUMVA|nr:hypothetical protein EVAR_91669_1 [Eumeta japonica]
MTSVLWPVIAILQSVASIFISGVFLYTRIFRAKFEISKLIIARRTAITVWILSPNDEEAAVAVARSGTGGARQADSLGGSWTALGG